MKVLIDSANLVEIERLIDDYPIDGVTTNPTILAKEQGDYLRHLREIRDRIGDERMLFVQTVSQNASEIVEEAKRIRAHIGADVYIKVPVILDGYKALKQLNRRGFKTLATAVFTAQQGLMAAKCGAQFVAPYVNRIDNMSGDGARVVADLTRLFHIYQLDTQVLAASFKNIHQVHRCSEAKVHAITASPEIIDSLHNHPSTEKSVAQFLIDWQGVFGKSRF
jgi:fructose-6-phosphate aldolase 2